MANVLFRENTSRESGKDVMISNITAVKTLSEMLKSSLGPRGLDKMLVSSTNDIIVTNDGATIVKELDIQHPAAKIIVETAKVQDSEVGDGTTTAVVLSGFLLEEAGKLLDQNIHPTIIIDGFKQALELSLKISKDIAIKINPENKDFLKEIAYTTLSSKFFSGKEELDKVIDIAINAILEIMNKYGDNYSIDLDNVKYVKKRGESISDVELIKGYVLDKEVAHEGMPKRVDEAKIAILDFALEVKKPEISAKLSIASPEQIKSALDEQARYIKSIVDKLASIGANVVICQKGMDDIAQYFLAKKGIMGIKNVSRSDIEKIAKTTGGNIISSPNDLDSTYLGYAKTVSEKEVGKEKAIFIEGVKQAKVVTILVRGATDISMDEVERSFNDVLNAIRNVIIYPYVVAGGGAFEEEIAMRLRNNSLPGKQQLALEAFANAVEEIAVTLAETAGIDPTEALVNLRTMHSKSLDKSGVDVMNGKIVEDITKIGVLDPLKVKEQVLKGAVEATSAILKIDDLIAAAPSKQPQQQGGEGGYPGMGGYGGYPGMM
ncbi:thermosome subunit alpha [Acidianus manzaensis]|uniref:Thermosome subunit n=1 Tax=Acidianus manzaensis TaxID=282676 RepID=A0A1W6JZC2_9CREN|nr:thermosome subunit alpha [Acidianus manzaensis]ARM75619.1 thermosome subunit [Acidianus manzaensis]